MIENEMVPPFYGRGDDGLPHDWIDRMTKNWATLGWNVTRQPHGARLRHRVVRTGGRRRRPDRRRRRGSANWPAGRRTSPTLGRGHRPRRRRRRRSGDRIAAGESRSVAAEVDPGQLPSTNSPSRRARPPAARWLVRRVEADHHADAPHGRPDLLGTITRPVPVPGVSPYGRSRRTPAFEHLRHRPRRAAAEPTNGSPPRRRGSVDCGHAAEGTSGATGLGRIGAAVGAARFFAFGGLMACLAAGYGVLFTIVDDYRDKYGISESSIGMVIGLGFLAGFLSQLLIAPYADRGHGCDRPLGVLVNVSGLVLMAMSTTLVPILLGASSPASAWAWRHLPSAASSSSPTPPTSGSNLGRLLAADVFGFALGPAVSAVLVGPFGIKAPFFVVAGSDPGAPAVRGPGQRARDHRRRPTTARHRPAPDQAVRLAQSSWAPRCL